MTVPVEAVRTLPDGTKALSRAGGAGGWFGLVLVPPADMAEAVDLGCGVTVHLDTEGRAFAVSYPSGKVTDSVLFYALRELTAITAALAAALDAVEYLP